jgi:hypothetical protein
MPPHLRRVLFFAGCRWGTRPTTGTLELGADSDEIDGATAKKKQVKRYTSKCSGPKSGDRAEFRLPRQWWPMKAEG